MALSDRLRSVAGRAAVAAMRAALRLHRFSTSSVPPPSMPGVGLPESPYPLTNPRTAARVSAPDALDVRIATRAGPMPTRVSAYPASRLDPSKIDRIFKSADLGIALWDYGDLCKQMRERDSHLMGIDRQRRQGVANKPFLIWPTSDTDPLAVAMANCMRAVVDGIDGLPSAVYSSLSKNCDGWSLSEIIWAPRTIRFQLPDGMGGGPMISVEGMWPRSIEWVHPKHSEFKFDSDEPLLNLGSDGAVPLPRHKFIYMRAVGEGIVSARGYSRSVVWMHFFKHATIRDWNVFLHLYGIPFLYGKAKREMWKDEKMKQVLELAIQAYGSGDQAPILPDGLEIDVKDPVSMGAAGDAHFRLAGFCNAEESKAVLGETLTTEAGESGSYKLGYVHQDSAHEVVVGDALWTAGDLRTDLFLSAIELNADELGKALNARPEQLPLVNPLCGFRTDREWTPEVRMKVFGMAADMAIPVSISQVRREIQLDKPHSPDDQVKGKPVTLPDGAKAVGSTEAAEGVDNPKEPPPERGPAPEER